MTAALADELTRHKQAYLELFKGVLAKRPMDAPAKEALIARLAGHMDSVIQTPDDLIPRIPEFAGMLGVGAQPLSTYIGTNFLQALQLVGKRAAAGPAASPAATSASQVKKSASFLGEVVQLATLPAGSRFAPHDAGFLKLVTPQGEVFSQSFLASGESGGVVQINFEAPPAASPAGTVQPVSLLGQNAPVRPPPAQSQGGGGQTETSFLKEILDRFGSSLDIPGKLVPRDYGSDIEDVEISDGTEEPEPEVSAPSGAQPARPGTPSAPAQPGRREQSILKEILDKFGNQLDIPGKLVPKDYGSEIEEVDFGQEEADEDSEESVAQEAADSAPIPFSFGNYIDTLKRLQDFQNTSDQEGYKTWLSREATPEAKILVAVRNFEKREKLGQPVNWQEEYYNLGHRLGAKQGYVSQVHTHLRRLGRVHAVWGSLMQKARSSPAPLMEDLKRLWPQIRLLFEEGGTQAMLNSRMQILLLAIADPGRKEAARAVLSPHLAGLAQALQE